MQGQVSLGACSCLWDTPCELGLRGSWKEQRPFYMVVPIQGPTKPWEALLMAWPASLSNPPIAKPFLLGAVHLAQRAASPAAPAAQALTQIPSCTGLRAALSTSLATQGRSTASSPRRTCRYLPRPTVHTCMVSVQALCGHALSPDRPSRGALWAVWQCSTMHSLRQPPTSCPNARPNMKPSYLCTDILLLPDANAPSLQLPSGM